MAKVSLYLQFLSMLVVMQLIGCGAPQEPTRLPQTELEVETPIPTKQKKKAKEYYSQGETLNQGDVLDIQILSKIKFDCVAAYCQWLLLKDENISDVIVSDSGQFTLLKSGDYLTKWIYKDRDPEVKRLHIGGGRDDDQYDLSRAGIHHLADPDHMMISHFEIRLDDATPSVNIAWEVNGGRYHILNEELPVHSVMSPFRRSILFKEFKAYEVSAVITKNGEIRERKSYLIDLRPLAQMTVNSYDVMSPVSLHYIRRVPTDSAVKMIGDLNVDAGAGKFEWEVRRVIQSRCADDILALENQDTIAVEMAAQWVCRERLEEVLSLDKEYEVYDAESSSATIKFKQPGKYAVVLKVKDGDGYIKGFAIRRIMIQPALLSSVE